jgi:hypothetical protein
MVPADPEPHPGLIVSPVESPQAADFIGDQQRRADWRGEAVKGQGFRQRDGYRSWSSSKQEPSVTVEGRRKDPAQSELHRRRIIDRLAIDSDQFSSEADFGSHRDLLSKNGTHGQLKTAPRPERAKTSAHSDEGGESRVLT